MDVLVIKFSAYTQRLRRITSGIIPSNAYGKLKFEFDFRTDDWKSVEKKTVNFNYRGENHYVELDANNQCMVPKEVINTPLFYVAVHGGDIVTNYVKNYVVDTNPNSEVIPPTPDEESSMGVVFVPSISEDKILSWTIVDNDDDVVIPDPVDLNPFDEWSNDGDLVSEYEWEDDV